MGRKEMIYPFVMPQDTQMLSQTHKHLQIWLDC